MYYSKKKIVFLYFILIDICVSGMYNPKKAAIFSYCSSQVNQQRSRNIERHSRTQADLVRAQGLGSRRSRQRQLSLHNTRANTKVDKRSQKKVFLNKIKNHYKEQSKDKRLLERHRKGLIKARKAQTEILFKSSEQFLRLESSEQRAAIEACEKRLAEYDSKIKDIRATIANLTNDYYNDPNEHILNAILQLEKKLATNYLELNGAREELERLSEWYLHERMAKSNVLCDLIKGKIFESENDVFCAGNAEFNELKLFCKKKQNRSKPCVENMRIAFVQKIKDSVSRKMEIESQQCKKLDRWDKELYLNYLKKSRKIVLKALGSAASEALRKERASFSEFCRAERAYLNERAACAVINERIKKCDALLKKDIKKHHECAQLEKEIVAQVGQMLDMISTEKENFTEKENASHKENPIAKELRNRNQEQQEDANRGKNILNRITYLYEEKVALNDAAIEYGVNANELERQESLLELKKTAEAVSEQDILDRYKVKEYDFSDISEDLLKKAGLSKSVTFFNITDLQDKMLHVVHDHLKGVALIFKGYTKSKRVTGFLEQNLECLKEAVACIKSNDLDNALTCLEKSWDLRRYTQEACCVYDFFNTAKLVIKAATKDERQFAKIVLEKLAQFGEIDMLVERGDFEAAAAKYDEMWQEFDEAIERVQNKWQKSSFEEKAIFVGEMLGNVVFAVVTKKVLSRGVFKKINPILIMTVRTAIKYFNKLTEKDASKKPN